MSRTPYRLQWLFCVFDHHRYVGFAHGLFFLEVQALIVVYWRVLKLHLNCRLQSELIIQEIVVLFGVLHHSRVH